MSPRRAQELIMARAKREPCDFCDGTLSPRRVIVDLRRGRSLRVIENVPALVCSQCGERYYTQDVMRRLERLAARRTRRTLKVPVVRFETVA